MVESKQMSDPLLARPVQHGNVANSPVDLSVPANVSRIETTTSITAADAVAPGIASPEKLVTSVQRSGNATPYGFRDLLALSDFERHAKRHLPPMVFQYVAGAVETGTSLRASRDAYRKWALLPRRLVDTAARSATTTLFGQNYNVPFGIAPLGGAAFVAYRGDLRLAEAARTINMPMILSASSLIKLEDVHAQNPDAWFQAYLPGDQSRIDRLTDRVAGAGFRTLVVTADTPVLGNREHNTRSGFSMPMRVTPKVAWQSVTHPHWLLGTVARTFYRHGTPHFENMEADRGPPMLSRNALRNTTARDKLSWDNLGAIRKRWNGTLLVKGLTTPADVEIARTCGVDGVILSTHGGRQLDYDVPPLEMLPRIAAQKGDMTLIIDSGIRRGTDILKALALGADFVLLGRPFLFAAAIGGAPGVLHAARILKEEVERDMALVGVTRLSELTSCLLHRMSDPS